MIYNENITKAKQTSVNTATAGGISNGKPCIKTSGKLIYTYKQSAFFVIPLKQKKKSGTRFRSNYSRALKKETDSESKTCKKMTANFTNIGDDLFTRILLRVFSYCTRVILLLKEIRALGI